MRGCYVRSERSSLCKSPARFRKGLHLYIHGLRQRIFPNCIRFKGHGAVKTDRSQTLYEAIPVHVARIGRPMIICDAVIIVNVECRDSGAQRNHRISDFNAAKQQMAGIQAETETRRSGERIQFVHISARKGNI